MNNYAFHIAGDLRHVDGRLQELATGSCRWLISDFDGAMVGVETLAPGSPVVPAAVEKSLRDSGQLETLSSLLVASKQRQAGIWSIAYTAVDLRAYAKHFAAYPPSRTLTVPLLSAMSRLASSSKMQDGWVAVVDQGHVDVLAFSQSQPIFAKRFALFESHSDPMSRVFDEVNQICPANSSIRRQVKVVELRQGISKRLVDLAGAEGCSVSVVPGDQLFAGLRLSDAVMPASNRLTWSVVSALPAMALSAVLLAAGLFIFAPAPLGKTVQQASAVQIADLERAIQTSEALLQQNAGSPEDILRLKRFSVTPDPSLLLRDLKAVQPDELRIVETGIVAEDDSTLIVVVAQSRTAALPVAAEQQLTDALMSRGYKVVNRTLTNDKGRTRLRLALTWSSN